MLLTPMKHASPVLRYYWRRWEILLQCQQHRWVTLTTFLIRVTSVKYVLQVSTTPLRPTLSESTALCQRHQWHMPYQYQRHRLVTTQWYFCFSPIKIQKWQQTYPLWLSLVRLASPESLTLVSHPTVPHCLQQDNTKNSHCFPIPLKEQRYVSILFKKNLPY